MERDTIVYDRVYGEVRIRSTLASQLLEGPLLSRLDNVRQLGVCSYVYPSATHTRREHSVGVYHLAGELAAHLRTVAHATTVTDDDIELVRVAGLLHDVGHGPFSHLFEEFVRGWSHETGTYEAVESLTELLPPTDRAFVLAVLRGAPRGATDDGFAARTGRPFHTHAFLLDVVHNACCGVDVDKMDYLVRDAQSVLGATQVVDVQRILRAADLVPDDTGVPRLSFHEHVAQSISSMFDVRTRLHTQLFQHRDVLVTERLVLAEMRRVGARASDSDADVLERFCPAALQSLFRRPRMWHVPLPFEVRRLPTRPLCTACHTETEIGDRYCAACGAATKDRRHATRADGRRVPWHAWVTGDAMTAFVRSATSVADAHVVVQDVQRGTVHSVPDPWDEGVVWMGLTVLSTVPFHTTGKQVVRLADDRVTHHQRTLYCYTETRYDDATAARLSEAVARCVRNKEGL